MPKLILRTESQGKVAFRQRSRSRDRLQLAILGIAAIAALTFLGSMVAVVLMRAP